MQKAAVALLFALVCLASGSSRADIVDTIYNTSVELADQRQAALRRGFRASFQQVLIKVSGGDALLRNGIIRQELANARDYIISFSFSRTNGQLYLNAQFDPNKVNDLVASAGFPVWGKRRPSILIWLAEQDIDGNRRLVVANGESNSQPELMRATGQRGIPIVFPLMDLAESNQIGLFDVWGRFNNVMRVASDKYNTEYVLSARLYPRDSEFIAADSIPNDQGVAWQLDWHFIQDELGDQGIVFASDKQDALRQLGNLLADYLAQKYAVMSSDANLAGSVTLQVLNLDSIEDYVQIVSFFESLTMISNVNLNSLSGTVAEFDLELTGSLDELLATIELDDKINQRTDAFGRTVESLEFLWNP